MAWSTICLKCWTAMPHPDGDPLWVSCLDCPGCGAHRCGAMQKQHDHPCTREDATC